MKKEGRFVRVGLIAVIFCFSFFASFGQKAFPDAIGFGAISKGAYAGSNTPKILVVDTLCDASVGNETTGRGSFRWAASRSYPRVILFERSGYIDLKSAINIRNPYVTIAGQTAPSPGITFRYYPIEIAASHVIVQHLRFRLGDISHSEGSFDAFSVYSGPNVYIDHCSFSWAIDENISCSSTSKVKNVTISNCIISEALYLTPNPNSPNGYGMLLYMGDSISIINNVFSNLADRAPMVNNQANHVLIANNLLFNTGTSNANIYFNTNSVALKASAVGNAFIRGDESSSNKIIRVKSDLATGSQIYLEDNEDIGRTSDPWSVVTGEKVKFRTNTREVWDKNFVPVSSKSLESTLLPIVGSRPLDRDAVDKRVISQITNRNGDMVDSQNDVGGYPALAINKRSLAIPSNAHADDNKNNYTNLEDWLYKLHRDLIYLSSSIVPVTGITVTGANGATAITSNKGTLQLSANVLPATATNKSVTWSVQNGTGQAAISTNGLLTASANGTVTVTATAADGSGVKGTLVVTISGQSVTATSVTVTGANGSTAITSNKGTLQLSASVLPATATNKNVTWSVQNGTGQATMSTNGLLTASANGTVTVTATAADGSGVKGTLVVTISGQSVTATSVTVTGANGATAIASNKGTLQLSASVLPSTATNKNVTWSVQNGTGQATMSTNGLLTASANGTVTVTATAADGSGVKGTLIVTISGQTIAAASVTVTGANGATAITSSKGTLQLSASVLPSTATNKSVTWSVQNGTGQAVITTSGLTTAVSDGTITAIATTTDGSGVTGSLVITISGQAPTAYDGETVYVDPQNTSDALQNGSVGHPYDNWNKITWESGKTYRQKRNTTANIEKLNILAEQVTISSYGEGSLPIINSTTKEYAIQAFSKPQIALSELHIIAKDAVGCAYFLGAGKDSITIDKCIFDGAGFGVRMVNGNRLKVRYSTFKNSEEALYLIANEAVVCYNVFTDNATAINLGSETSSKVDVYNNVFYGNSCGIASSYAQFTSYNNIFYLKNAGDLAINSALNEFVSDNNLFFPERNGFVKIASNLFNSLEQLQSYNKDLHSFIDDPGFKDMENKDFRVNDQSPAIDAGKIINAIGDFFGNIVPQGNTTDIGIEEKSKSGAGHTAIQPDQEEEMLQVFPNPNNGQFNVSLNFEPAESIHCKLMDVSGKQVYNRIFDRNEAIAPWMEINLTDRLSQGIYFLVVKTGQSIFTSKVIID